MPDANEAIFLEWIAAKREDLDRRNLEKERRGHLARRIYPQDIFQEILNVLGSQADPMKPWPQDILFNLGRLSTLITHFEAVHQWVTPSHLKSLCILFGGWAAGQMDEGRLDESVSTNAVQIMTIHGAKGLEWPVVFIPQVSSYTFPSSLRNRGPETFLDETLFDPREYGSGDEGERRLWYVAQTRCQKFLNISSQDRKRKRPTIFFRENSHDCIQRDGLIEDREKGTPTRPANVELLPTTFSDLNYFWRCPFEYQLRSLMGFMPGVKESYGYGQQIHNVLAEVHMRAKEGKHLSADDVEKLMEERFHLRYTRDGETFKPLSELRKAAKLSLSRFLKRYPDHTRYVLDAEKPFEFIDRESRALISGNIDLLQRVETTPSGEERRIPVAVVDFKAHRWKDSTGFFRRRSEVENQLRLYAVAVREALGFGAHEAIAHFLSPKPPSDDLLDQGVQETVHVNISLEKQKEIRSRVREGVEGIRSSVESGNFELKGCLNDFCRDCDYRKICPGYKQWEKIDKITPRPLSPEESRREEILLVMEDVDAG